MSEVTFACSLTDEELATRRREWRALDERALLRTETLPHGRLLVYGGGDRTARVLTGLLEAERRCCPFLDFSIDNRDGELLVTIGFAPEASETTVELGIFSHRPEPRLE